MQVNLQMGYIFLLSTHIILGILSLLASGYALLAILRRKSETYSNLAKSIAAIALFEIGSGFGLVLMQWSTDNMIHYCARIGVYLLVIGAVEGLLLYKLKQSKVFGYFRSVS